MTIQKSEQIKTEINQVAKRCDELIETQKTISDNLKGLQKDFIDGTIKLDKMQVEQSRLTVLTDSVKALEARRAELETDLKAATAAEFRAEVIKQLIEAAHRAANSYSEYTRIAGELNADLEQKTGALLDHIAVITENKNKFRRLYFQIAPRADNQMTVPGENTYLIPEILNELNQAGISADELQVATTGILKEPDGEFSGIILSAKQIASQKRHALKEGYGVLKQ